MVYTFLLWCVVGGSVFLWGVSIIYVLSKITGYQSSASDFVIMAGLCGLTVYAQTVSLVFPVNVAALCDVIMMDFGILVIGRREIRNWICVLRKLHLYQKLLLPFLGKCVLIMASGPVGHYDTALYHAQAIHWIKDYEVVPGLGNLHHRLAYNRSFLCLQALFSFCFLAGQSMHSMNGFIMWGMISYAICSMKCWKRKHFFTSDFLRLVIIFYYAGKARMVSSPETGRFTLGLAAYIYIDKMGFIDGRW